MEKVFPRTFPPLSVGFTTPQASDSQDTFAQTADCFRVCKCTSGRNPFVPLSFIRLHSLPLSGSTEFQKESTPSIVKVAPMDNIQIACEKNVRKRLKEVGDYVLPSAEWCKISVDGFLPSDIRKSCFLLSRR
ncbi:hypothetical protein AVEN_130522-1 [Araneus ventricosus]|uniref:Uncharacterized protein n=1 Tax=Araneus ventricosus TaxID=182803 RepID=A0A4Y2ELD0_ARAVE|nr:hypothetical protein AVEN_130522-1 [Araneus ventricosus]